jgi:hypothetical protein
VPYRVGSLVPATERQWESGDREEWLLRTLPSIKSRLVVLLDASDAVLFCDSLEIATKWRQLSGSELNGRDGRRSRVLIGVEQQLWPEEQFFVVGKRKTDYPRASMGHFAPRPLLSPPKKRGTPFRFINIGMLAGPPRAIHQLLQCMQEQYPGFPRRCPVGRFANGSYEWVSDAPHATRFGIFKGHWGWEQSCFHNYYYEQRHGLLPTHCPELALDYRAEFILNMKKSTEHLILDWGSNFPRPRLNDTVLPSLQDVRPCVLHANSATKSLMPVLQLYWDKFAAQRDSHNSRSHHGEGALSKFELTTAVGHWAPALVNKSTNPCVILALKAGLSESSARMACSIRRWITPMGQLCDRHQPFCKQ